MKQGWEIRPFEKCIEKVKYTTKIATCDYSTMGAYPVVSQEEEYISGYWNNAEDVFRVSKPVVIFGDHTRVLKYVDFDFVLGADGVKILQPIDAINAKFFLYYLIASKIPSLGYSRHYKLLKELNVPVPPIAEQEKIVAELDCLSGIIEKKKQQLKELDNLAQSIFYEMFGDPVENDKGWEKKRLAEIGKVITGNTPSTKDESNYSSADYCFVKPSDIAKDSISYISNTEFYVSEKAYINSRQLPKGSVLTTCIGIIGKVGILQKDATCNQQINAIIPNKDIDAKFLAHVLFMIRDVLTDVANAPIVPIINKKEFSSVSIPVPLFSLQQDFASKIQSIEKQKELIAQSIKETETLFNSRMDYYFN